MHDSTCQVLQPLRGKVVPLIQGSDDGFGYVQYKHNAIRAQN